MKDCLKNYIRSCGSRGAAAATNTTCSSGSGSAATPSAWDFAIKYELFNKIGGGFYFYGSGNPASKWWDSTPTKYDLKVFYKADAETGKYYINSNYYFENVPILKSGKSYIYNIQGSNIGTLGDAISHSFYVDSEEEICVFFAIYASDFGWCSSGDHTSREIYSTPYNIAYADGQVTFNCDTSSYVTACEFKTSSTKYPYSTYSDTVRQLFYEAACQETETNYEHKFYNKKFKRWDKTQVTVGVNFMSSVSSSLRADFKGYVQQTIDIVNSRTAGSGFSLKLIDGITGGNYQDYKNRNGNGDIQVWWGDYEELWDEPVPDNYRYFGMWETNATENQTYITEASVRLCTEKVWMMNYQGITYEEIVEALGAGNDVRYLAESVYSDFWFTNKNLNSSNVLSPYKNDLYVLELLYNYDLPSNVDNWVIAKMINAPNGARSVNTRYASSGAIDLTFLDSSTTYNIRLISADYDNTSEYSSYKSITTPTRPDYFSWDTQKTQGASFKLTASEWNSFTRNINMIRTYKNYSTYSFTTVKTGDTITATIYNEARKAIQGISGYGAYIPTVSARDNITAYCLNQIVSELNAIP